jgi:Cysteine-rich CPCC
MKVRAVRNRYVDCPPHVAWKGSRETQTYLTIGKEYEVYAVSFYGGCLLLLVIRDGGFQSFVPSWFFEIVDMSLPADWRINLFDDRPDLQGAIGPEFFVRDGESYDALIESYPEAVEKFLRYVDKRARACPCCNIATVGKIGEYDICPTCDWVDDPYQRSDVNLAGGVNKLSLTEAREVWKKTLKRLE